MYSYSFPALSTCFFSSFWRISKSTWFWKFYTFNFGKQKLFFYSMKFRLLLNNRRKWRGWWWWWWSKKPVRLEYLFEFSNNVLTLYVYSSCFVFFLCIPTQTKCKDNIFRFALSEIPISIRRNLNIFVIMKKLLYFPSFEEDPLTIY